MDYTYQFDVQRQHPFGIVALHLDNRPVGSCGFLAKDNMIELGPFFCPLTVTSEFRGNDLGYSIVIETIGYAIRSLEEAGIRASTLTAKTGSGNIHAIDILERLGFCPSVNLISSGVRACIEDEPIRYMLPIEDYQDNMR